jgi:hypothetical protein
MSGPIVTSTTCQQAFVGNASRAAFYSAAHAKSKAAFNAAFWQSSLRRYYDWIDVDGHAREYAYVDVDLLAIMGGVANETQVNIWYSMLYTACLIWGLERACCCWVAHPKVPSPSLASLLFSPFAGCGLHCIP